MNKRVVLVCCMGTSPSVLTETVWALAHQKPAIVPDEIVVLVTKSGRDILCREILTGTPNVWERMCASLRKEKVKIEGKLVFGETSIRVIPDAKGNGIADLRSGGDNLRAADFMLQQLRQYTETSDTVVLASIAGGRKTMSALLFSCMTLLGREDDKVFHVLLPPEFEGGVEPPMYYPVKGVTYTNRFTGKKYKSDKFHGKAFEMSVLASLYAQLLFDALELFYANDAAALFSGKQVDERTMVGCIYRYMWWLLQSCCYTKLEHDIDIEYDKMRLPETEAIRKGLLCLQCSDEYCRDGLFGCKEVLLRMTTNPQGQRKNYKFRPDIIVHSRNSDLGDRNGLIVEFKKKYRTGRKLDIAKVRYCTCPRGSFHYKIGATAVLCKNMFEVVIYREGRRIAQLKKPVADSIDFTSVNLNSKF